MSGAYSKLLSHLRCCFQPGSSASIRRLLSSPTPTHGPCFLASLNCFLPLAQSPFQFHRQFSASPSGDDSELWRFGDSTGARIELDDPTTSGLSEVANRFTDDGSIFPVESVIWLLDHYHDITGFPWWAVIASSTLAMRITLFPVLVLQLKKLKTIGECMPKLPPPLPPLFSGRSYFDHISLFRRKRRASGCPSLLWMFASPAIQGGVLWFQDLTVNPQGIVGLILPLLIAGLHYTNVQGYKMLLQFMSLPIVYGSCCLPQGCLIYWITNLSSSILLQTIIHHPSVRLKLGLVTEVIPKEDSNSDKIGKSESASLDPNRGRTSIQDLAPRELLALSVQVISQGNRNEGIPLLELALDKDPEYVRAMVVLGQTLLQTEEPEEAAEYLERAVSKLFGAGNPMENEGENLDLLILASQWAGVAYIRQSKIAEGLVHLERIATLKEPNEPKIKAHYYDGLVLLSSALFNEGRTAEAAKHLRLAAAYDSKYNELLEQCEKES